MLLFFPGSKTRDLQCILLFMIFRSTSRYAGYAWNSKRVAISRMPSTEWPLMPTVALSVVLSQCVDALESRKAKQSPVIYWGGFVCDDGVPSLQGVCTLCACRTFVTYPARQQKKECESVSLLLSCYRLRVMFCSGVPTLTVGNKKYHFYENFYNDNFGKSFL